MLNINKIAIITIVDINNGFNKLIFVLFFSHVQAKKTTIVINKQKYSDDPNSDSIYFSPTFSGIKNV